MQRYVIMGVSGCGKSSVGAEMAQRCGVEFVDGDDLNPPANVAKMASGQALNDDDRAPWLADVGKRLAANDGAIAIACSALKRAYRDMIRAQVPGAVHFLHLAADKQVLARRVAERAGHFMPPALLDSQFATLEPLAADEVGQAFDVAASLEDVMDQVAGYVARV